MMDTRTHQSALCIVPPLELWDSIQRARFLAKDDTLYRWPPVIRLFHPFAPRPYLAGAASALSDLVEELEIEPFEITLDKLVILPHVELLEEMELIREGNWGEVIGKNVANPEEQETDVAKLIRDEEMKGVENKLAREEKSRERKQKKRRRKRRRNRIMEEE